MLLLTKLKDLLVITSKLLAKKCLRHVIGNELEEEESNIFECDDDYNENRIMPFLDDLACNTFTQWGKEIEQEAKNSIVQGDRDN